VKIELEVQIFLEEQVFASVDGHLFQDADGVATPEENALLEVQSTIL
jgi:hypothetical protein